MSINWNNLRPWNGDQRNSFEELCCQLVAQEPVPGDSRFFRKGRPDAGLECYWRLPNNDEWGMQAKFFLTTPTAGQWTQINNSIKKALETHPRLTKYYVCLPIDRSDARIGNQKSFKDSWDDHVAKWGLLAKDRKMAVEFEYWGESEIGNRMALEHNRGRHWFWFDEERFSNEWFRNRIDEAVDNARDRFSPDFNVDLPIRAVFDALGRTPPFFEKFDALYSKTQIKFKKLRPPIASTGTRGANYDSINSQAAALFSKMSPWVHLDRDYVEPTVTRSIPWEDIETLAIDLGAATNTRMSEIDNLIEERDKGGQKTRDNAYDNLTWELHYLREFGWSIVEIRDYTRSDYSQVSNLPYLLLTGEAGQGKTHLLCQVAREETYASRPRIMFHGEQFRDDEPWSQMIRLMGLNCSREEFLGALEAAAQANNCRILIFIDALNEGAGNRLWAKFLPGMLTALARLPWLGICVSVRSSYEHHVIPDTLDETRIARLEHRGFTELPYEAISRFFSNYGIEPSTPFLEPEFTNPLFLKLFCISLQNQGLTRVPLGLRGITSIFQFYIKSIDAKLSRPEVLDYDVRHKNVARAVGDLARAMAKINDDRLPLNDAKVVVDAVLPPVAGFQASLFSRMESEGVITVVPDYSKSAASAWEECVRFTYQRFSDHLIVQRLLEQYLDTKNPEASFSIRRTLGKLVKDERACRVNSGILGALMIQIPELTKRELPDIAPRLADMRPVRDAFVQSFVWRDMGSFGSTTDSYINQQVLNYKGSRDEFLNAVITLSPLPGHPYNADRLHKFLAGFNMPDRDAWWSVFLHHAWGCDRSVDRLVAWAWVDTDKSKIDDEVIRLAGITLAWFLTTPNRFLRDRATKAMVRLFENRIQVLINVLSKLKAVEDPYVTERLYAVAYACAMRTADVGSLNDLSTWVYRNLFKSDNPPTHLLTRDYARGVIEVSIHRGATLNVDLAKVRPPYKSEWPGLSVPEGDELQAWGAHRDGMPDSEWSRVQLYDSVMGRLTGDFSHYVIGDLQEWSSERLDQLHTPTHRESCDLFVDSLTSRQKEAWEVYEGLRRNIPISLILGPENTLGSIGVDHPVGESETSKLQAEERFIRTLGTTSKKYRQYIDVVKPYVDNPTAFSREDAFDNGLARRWLMQRVIDLGWTVDRFGDFDRWVNYRHTREARKPERVGKKYQWIAYNELLARLADNFKLRAESWSVQTSRYNGPWNLFRHGRDIDGSNLLKQSQADEWEPHKNTWWFPTEYKAWDEPPNEVGWLKKSTDLPGINDILEVVWQEDGSRWLTLNGFYHWEQSTPPGEEHYERKRREIWYIVKSYLVKKSDLEELRAWASDQSWSGRRLPESHASYEIYLGEFFWSSAFKDHDTHYYGREGWTRGDNDTVPSPILVTNDEYGRSDGSFDCSIDSSIFINLPCRFLAEGMNLDWKGIEGNWYGDAGQLVACDPSIRSPGPRSLLFRRDSLIEFLDSRGLSLFWTVLGEKQSLGGSMSHQDYNGRLEINGFYYLDSDTVGGKTVSRYAPPLS